MDNLLADADADLLLAARQGDLDVLRDIVDEGFANLNARSPRDMTPLMEAACNGHLDCVEVLLDSGANIEAVTDTEWTTLIFASLHGHLDVVQLLVERGANINHSIDDFETALHWASYYDRQEICEFLLSRGADWRAGPPSGWTAQSRYGYYCTPQLSADTISQRLEALEAAFAAGLHLSQVQRRNWERRRALLMVLVENGYRPLLHRFLAEKAAIVSLDPAAPIPGIDIDTPAKRHAHLLGQVLSNEGIHRLIVRML